MRTSALLAGLGLVLVVTGCGGDDDGGAGGSPATTREAPVGTTRAATEEESSYFAALTSVLDEAQGAALALEDARAEAFDSGKGEAERQEAATALAADVAASLEKRRDDILNVKPQPPPSMHSLHLALGAAADDMVTATAEVRDTVAEQPVSTEAEYDAVLANVGVEAVEERFRDACFALEDESVLLELDLDLHCEG